MCEKKLMPKCYHANKLIYDNEKTKYFECRKCGIRTYRQVSGTYQPVDHRWLNGEVNYLPTWIK